MPRNMGHRKEYLREYYKSHKKEYIARAKLWNNTHIQRQKKFHDKSERKRYYALRKKVLEHLGNKCVRCGFSDPRALQIDHVHGHGTKELKKLSLNCGYLKKVLADIEGNYQLLCANCNWIKRSENREVRSSSMDKIP